MNLFVITVNEPNSICFLATNEFLNLGLYTPGSRLTNFSVNKFSRLRKPQKTVSKRIYQSFLMATVKKGFNKI